MTLGAPVWVFQWHPPYDEAIRRIAGLGFSTVELIAWNRTALDEYYTPATIGELRRVIDGEGLRLSEFVSTAWQGASPDAAQRERTLDDFRKMIDVAVALGAPVVNTVASAPLGLRVPHLLLRAQMQQVTAEVPGQFRNASAWKENYKAYVDFVRACCALCEQAGVVYAVEPHPFRHVNDAQSMLRLIDHVGSHALGINYDPSHTFPSGDLPHFAVYQLGDRVFHTHLSDNDGLTNAHWRPGMGKIDWKAFLVALNEVGYSGTLSLEMEDVPGVSGHGPDSSASTAFDEECKRATFYLKGLASEAGIVLE